MRLFIWHDQIKQKSTKESPDASKPDQFPPSPIKTNQVFTNHYSSLPIKSSLSPTTAPAFISSVTTTLHAYMSTMVGGEGIVDEGISTMTSFSQFNNDNTQPWARSLFVHQNSVTEARNSTMDGKSSTVMKSTKKVLDKVLKKQKDGAFEPQVWTHLTQILFQSTIGTFRVPEDISDIFMYKFKTIPYWGLPHNYCPRGGISSLVQFAAHIFLAFIEDAIVLAFKWWEEFLSAYGGSI